MDMTNERELKEFFEKEKEKFGKRIFSKNNKVNVKGILTENITFSHKIHQTVFYKTVVEVQRHSGKVDKIPLIIPEKYFQLATEAIGKVIEVWGVFESYFEHNYKGRRRCLKVYLYAKKMSVYDECEDTQQNNLIFLNGYICKEIIYRKTPLKTKISEIMLAVNGPRGKLNYIPCISWEKNAKEMSHLKIGDHIMIYGRIQSRENTKKVEGSETTEETIEIYEVSISRYCIVEK